jgi:hypothetical protein
VVARIDPSAFDADDSHDEPMVTPEREANTPEELLRTALDCDLSQAAYCRELFLKVDAGNPIAYLQDSFRRLCAYAADAQGKEWTICRETIDMLTERVLTAMAALETVRERLRREKENDQ